MDSKIHKQLEEAKSLFYSHRLVEAYNILRRFYDRLPFEQRPEHAEYIAMFARILAELGKESDLKFYLAELERLYEKYKSPGLGYQLGFVYTYTSRNDVMPEVAKKLFEDILKNPEAKQYHVKAKLMLADYYDSVKNDIGTCRQIIDSIHEVDSPDLQQLVDIWRGKILRDEGQYAAAEAQLKDVLSRIDASRNWYAYYSAQLLLAYLYFLEKRFQEAEALIAEVRRIFENKRFKSMLAQFAVLEKKIADARKPSEIQLRVSEETMSIAYETKSLVLNVDAPADKFLMLLAKKGFLDKAFIVKNLFQKSYNGEQDDKLIYHAVHQARKKLQSVGIPKDAVESVESGYRLVPKVRIIKEVS